METWDPKFDLKVFVTEWALTDPLSRLRGSPTIRLVTIRLCTQYQLPYENVIQIVRRALIMETPPVRHIYFSKELQKVMYMSLWQRANSILTALKESLSTTVFCTRNTRDGHFRYTRIRNLRSNIIIHRSLLHRGWVGQDLVLNRNNSSSNIWSVFFFWS